MLIWMSALEGINRGSVSKLLRNEFRALPEAAVTNRMREFTTPTLVVIFLQIRCDLLG